MLFSAGGVTGEACWLLSSCLASARCPCTNFVLITRNERGSSHENSQPINVVIARTQKWENQRGAGTLLMCNRSFKNLWMLLNKEGEEQHRIQRSPCQHVSRDEGWEEQRIFIAPIQQLRESAKQFIAGVRGDR
jgi:hypothetical protein